MTGKFSAKDPERCQHYARFMSSLSLLVANSIFWSLFVFVLILMCISSFYHHKSIDLAAQEKTLPTVETNTPQYRTRVRRLRTHYLTIVTFCILLAIPSAILEAFAAFNIEYCDGEDLMQLYWGFWSILQVGSIIAILGVMVQFWIVLGSHESPSWAVALGTPVLVFAALGWLTKVLGKRAWRRICSIYWGRAFREDENSDRGENDMEKGRQVDEKRYVEDEEDEDDDIDEEKREAQGGRNASSRRMSKAPTIVPDSTSRGTTRAGLESPSPDREKFRRSSTF